VSPERGSQDGSEKVDYESSPSHPPGWTDEDELDDKICETCSW